jgi:TIR domain
MSEPISNGTVRSCFVSMPFGRKVAASGTTIDFDAIYSEAIRPAVAEAGLESVRADMELAGGLIHAPMFSRLLGSEFCVCDLTTANPNVFYEMGIRHAARASITIAIYSESERLPFDTFLLRAIPYVLNDGRLDLESAQSLRAALTARLSDATQHASVDSPLFQLLDRYPGIDTSFLERAPQVFFSYSRLDADRVQPFYEKLARAGFKPWLDTKDMLPGEDWHRAIEIAIRKSDFFVAFLSRNSVNRRGIIQTELRNAVDKAKEMLDSDIYLIPVRLEQCDLPESLSQWQAVDLFQDPGWDLFLRALNEGVRRRSDLSVAPQ